MNTTYGSQILVSAYAEKKLDQPKGAPPKLSIRLSVYSATLNSFNRERSILKVAREPKQVAAEIGGLSFVVNDISEWRGMNESTDSISLIHPCLTSLLCITLIYLFWLLILN